MVKPELIVIIPTYLEEKTIFNAITTVGRVLDDAKISHLVLVVDDDSPDGTAKEALRALNAGCSVLYVKRMGNRGLSPAVVDGFAMANTDIVAVTDADLSHDVRILPAMYRKINDGYDIAIGSRYMTGGGVKEDWPWYRKTISWGATVLARFLFPRYTDPGSGFFMLKRSVVDNVELKTKGYKILFEILGKSEYNRVIEIPYTFSDRKEGESKLGKMEIVQYVVQLADIAMYPGKARVEVARLVKFVGVGAAGVVVNSAFLIFFYQGLGLPVAAAGAIATEISILTNFVLNDELTFADLKKNGVFSKRLTTFNIVALGGLAINTLVLTFFTRMGVYYLLANLIGIVAAFGWNYTMNRRITWGDKK